MDKIPEFISNHQLLVGGFAAVLFLLIFSEISRKLKKFKEIDPKEAVSIINRDDPLILDLRPETDFKKGHIAGAKSYSLENIETKAKELDKFKDRGIIVYASNPNTAVTALGKLVAQGHQKLYNISGGIQVWVSENFPVEKSKR